MLTGVENGHLFCKSHSEVVWKKFGWKVWLMNMQFRCIWGFSFPAWPISAGPTLQCFFFVLSEGYFSCDRLFSSRHRLWNLLETRRRTPCWRSVGQALIGQAGEGTFYFFPWLKIVRVNFVTFKGLIQPHRTPLCGNDCVSFTVKVTMQWVVGTKTVRCGREVWYTTCSVHVGDTLIESRKS